MHQMLECAVRYSTIKLLTRETIYGHINGQGEEGNGLVCACYNHIRMLRPTCGLAC